ncbi:MAG: RnfABCDGE type electron transport complex subunit B [Deltaproteobacteria bacterium]|nr:RnfABCDGE type electron transport complex subunit B [Deltaproteobacteria bacterium]
MLIAGLALGALGFVAALGLSIASRVFYVYVDPRVELVEDALAGANCGGCGYAGCNAAARAVVEGKAPVNVCMVGGQESAEEVAKIMGVPVEYKEIEFSERTCRGGRAYAPPLYEYIGVQDCRAAYMIGEGPVACEYACLGFGTCVRNCPFDAITMTEINLPQINYDKCTGCGTCERVCPRHVMRIVSESAKVLSWNQTDSCQAPCQATCPTQIEIPRYIGFIAERRFEEALQVIKQHNPMPLCIGRVCPAPCEDVCRRNDVDEPVNINDLKRFVADLEYQKGEHIPVFVHPDTGHKVAIIGGGPAGLTCAYYLRRLGHSPTIFERMPQLGGALRYGIPEYRLPKKVLDWEIEGMLGIGIEARTNVDLGKDVTYDSLVEEGFEAFFIATGTPRGLWTRVEGEDLQGVSAGIDFLRAIALGEEITLGQRVIVIGGGNVAIDVALSALRLPGVEEVYMVCLEDRFHMPAWEHEIQDALAEGVILNNSWGPKRMIGENGKVVAVEFKRCLSVFDDTGRFNPSYDESQLMRIDADNVIVTIGQGTDVDFIKSDPTLSQLQLTPRGTVVVNPNTMQTNLPNVFASGELTTGPNIAIQAIAGGRMAAWSIHQYLNREGEEVPIIEPIPNMRTKALDLVDREELKKVPKSRREAMPRIPVKERKKNWREVNLGLDEEQAVRAAKRCLNCGIYCLRPSYESKVRDFLKKTT